METPKLKPIVRHEYDPSPARRNRRTTWILSLTAIAALWLIDQYVPGGHAFAELFLHYRHGVELAGLGLAAFYLVKRQRGRRPEPPPDTW